MCSCKHLGIITIYVCVSFSSSMLQTYLWNCHISSILTGLNYWNDRYEHYHIYYHISDWAQGNTFYRIRQNPQIWSQKEPPALQAIVPPKNKIKNENERHNKEKGNVNTKTQLYSYKLTKVTNCWLAPPAQREIWNRFSLRACWWSQPCQYQHQATTIGGERFLLF